MLDISALVDAEEAERVLVADAVAIDQTLDLGAGDTRKLAFISVERAQPGGIRPPRQLPEGVDQRLGLSIELLLADPALGLAEAAGEHQPQGRMVLLAGFDAFFLGQILGE